MGTHIRIRRGAKKNMPTAAPSGMPLYCEDTNQLFIGTGSGVKIPDADTLDGLHASAFARASHTHQMPTSYVFTCGITTGTTTYVYPPSGYTMSNLVAFIPSIRTIHYNGDVDKNDSMYCYYAYESSRICITCYNSEQRANPQANWLAVWRA